MVQKPGLNPIRGCRPDRWVGELARPVSGVADEFGVCWDTIMTAVVTHGTPLVSDPDRVGMVSQLGVDETSFLKANRFHPTLYATALVDTDAGILIDMVEGNTAADLREWGVQQSAEWLAGVGTVDSGDRSDRLVPVRTVPTPQPCDPCRGSVPRCESGEPVPGQGATPSAKRDTSSSGT